MARDLSRPNGGVGASSRRLSHISTTARNDLSYRKTVGSRAVIYMAVDKIISVILPESIWRAIYITLTVEMDASPYGSYERGQAQSTIELIERQTGLSANDLPEDLS